MKRWIICAVGLALALTVWGWTPVLAQDEDGDGIDDVVTFRHWHGRHAGASATVWAQLDDAQKAALKARVDEMKAAGAAREDIHAAVGEMLTGYGIELPENWDKMPAFGRRGRGGFGPGLGLTEAQQAELKALVEDQKAVDATWVEVREAVDAKLGEWGIERPERRMGPFGSPLTEEQRAELKGIIDGLKAENAARADIRAAVGAYLTDKGIALPEKTGRQGRFGRFGRRHRGPAPENETSAE